jgi:exosortase D (VPLPA-CTERM-specific)
LRWDSEDNSYAYLIVPVFIFLLWEKRPVFHFGEFSWNLWGLVVVALSILVMVAGELGSMETLLFVGIWGCIVGVLFILYGLRLAKLWFPVLILVFIVPLPPFINRLLTFNFKMAASSLSVMMLRLTGVSVFQTGNIIDLGITQLQVVDACSGLRYFVSLVLIGLLVSHFFCRRLWQKGLLLLLVMPVSIVVTSFRIFVTAKLHLWGYPELAENLFHDLAGLVIFMLAGSILFGIAMVLSRLDSRPEPQLRPDRRGRPRAAWLAVTVTLVICLAFLTGGQTLQRLPTAKNLPERASFETFPMTIAGWQAKREYLSQAIIDSLWSDDYVSATYFAPDNRHAIHLLIPFYEYQGTRHTAHAPQSCMLGGGWTLINSHEYSATTGDGTRFPIMTTVWEMGDTRLLGSYFFFQRGRTITSPWMNKYWLMVDAFTRRRTDGALVRAEMVMIPGQTVDEAFEVLEAFVGELYGVLPEYVPL